MEKENKKILAGKKTVDKLIKTAKKHFAERGYSHTAMADVAKDAEASRGALYHHFNNKQELYEAVLEEILADIYVQIMKATRNNEDPWDKLLISSNTFLELSTHPVTRQIVIIDAYGVLGVDGLRKIDENYSISAIKSILAELKDTYSLNSLNIEVLAEAIYGASQQCAVWVSAQKDSKSALSEANATMELLYSSLKPVEP